MSKTVVLAYSGGLDTSFCIAYLAHNQEYNVHAVHVDTGGFSDTDIKVLEERAYALGAKQFISLNVKEKYYEDCIKYLIYGNVLRNNCYPVSVSSERVFQALAIIDYASNIQAEYVAHGSTGAGNDQIRFDLIFKTLQPEIKIISPIRDLKLSRENEVNYLKEKGFHWSGEKQAYSVNKGLWGTTIGGKETLSSASGLPDNAYVSRLKKKSQKTITIDFEKGEPVRINNQAFAHPVDLIDHLNEIGSEYAIGRDIHVGDTTIGIKGRVAFEAPAALILIKSHHLLEKHVLSKWQNYWKNQLAEWYGMMLHEGQYLAPVMRNIEHFMEDTQKYVTGQVSIKLKAYHFELEGIVSDFDLMQSKYGVYGEMNNSWTADEAKGFIKILSNPAQIYYDVHKNFEFV